MDDSRLQVTTPRDPLVRPLLWRLPLVAVVAIGLACLAFLDGLLRREYRANATTHRCFSGAVSRAHMGNSRSKRHDRSVQNSF